MVSPVSESAPSLPNPPSAAARPPCVLVADDQADVLEALRLLLKRDGLTVVTSQSPAGALATLEAEDVDLVLMDLNYARDTTSGQEGIDLLGRIRAQDASLPVVVMTAWGSVEGAVEAMRAGARDYVQKPWDNTRLLATLRTQLELRRALKRSRRLEEENQHLRRGQGNQLAMVSESRSMQPVRRLIERVAPSGANVLVTGEHGTGKEVVARLIHGGSTRSERAFVAVNSGGLSEGVFESELFGHVKGAFTDAKSDRIGCFELADGGTLFLDEIGNMPLSQQAKLLRVLQTGELHPVGSSKTRRVDVRVVSATNVDLSRAVAEGRFREDLLYRLNTVEVQLPPLRERREDIPLLAAHFLAEQGRRYGRPNVRLSSEALEALLAYAWPGNVRELEHAVERAMLMASGDEVTQEDLLLKRAGREGMARLEEMTLEEVERYLIERALARHEGNVSEAAKGLGLSRSALYRRLQYYGIKGAR
ncbi:sigma-54 dependent DNA-binding response regulator [Myxococcus xanthus DK 1622]|uniref:Sigma-54 dependent DNA-binding response regulator n=3 Tax=Myxococcus TaxID=32 RepID=Q1CWG7_MYXXD|nr:sigma-54 dependent transcriptional regulator [Myxococcus xanthus]ABF86032.1 sigma-54 dependent DNA-binding response regulator [Myxococcus xanthus DK 1622]QPM79410.1 sigma-54-dependent Fis family transcriptional regulator [Myxococcus xanthus]QVW68490.1 sigma-54-dependent Fis family transcriptional regulator [Myxococcus xanthus DZ2]UEO05397.1 sigma-54 dependent transcriptional regulator [Myxococcus xanthus DZ2]UYI14378.1 sigma-54 dependent transcriptional regulator [Myxococcus xanthus]